MKFIFDVYDKDVLYDVNGLFLGRVSRIRFLRRMLSLNALGLYLEACVE